MNRFLTIGYIFILIILSIYILAFNFTVELQENKIIELETTVNKLEFEKDYLEYVEADNIRQVVINEKNN